ncbi:MAG: hypothetical protein Q8K78_10640 [Planctomycetaceae bacterium]|nr:hypothetical protein [Planctomycetaceae bacterium]
MTEHQPRRGLHVDPPGVIAVNVTADSGRIDCGLSGGDQPGFDQLQVEPIIQICQEVGSLDRMSFATRSGGEDELDMRC